MKHYKVELFVKLDSDSDTDDVLDDITVSLGHFNPYDIEIYEIVPWSKRVGW